MKNKCLLRIRRQGYLSDPGVWLNRILLRMIRLCCILVIVLIGGMPVEGQVSQSLLVQPPTTEDFPILSVQIKPPNTVEFEGLQLERDQIQVFENEEQVDILSLDQTHVGVHFTLAINGSTFFDLNDENGISPYDRIREALETWVSTRYFAEADSWSLITNEGVRIWNTSSGEVWRMSLVGYEPNFRNVIPDLVGLSTAIENARDRMVPFGVDKSILYITTPPSAQQIESINALALEAQLASIQVNVWMVGDAYFLTNDQGGSLINLAQNTGGSFFSYTGTEPLPDPEPDLSGLGFFYTLTYETSIRETGSYSLRVQIDTPEGEISGEGVPFYIEVEPPNPILLTPPETIERRFEQVAEADDLELYPDLAEINIMIEFPDGHPREIMTSRLIVDGEAVIVKDQPPFDAFTWDISKLDASGEHVLQVEVRDSLGLTGQTIETPVQILVVEPEIEIQPLLKRPWFIALLVGLGALLVFGIIWLIRRLWQQNRLKKTEKDGLKEALSSEWRDLFGPDDVRFGEGRLQTLRLEESLEDRQSFAIQGSKMVIGSDPALADVVFEDPSVVGRHALLHYHQGQYWISPLDESGGTWVNYKLLNRYSVPLQSGDIIHIGDLGFQFTIIDADHPPEVTVSKYKP